MPRHITTSRPRHWPVALLAAAAAFACPAGASTTAAVAAPRAPAATQATVTVEEGLREMLDPTKNYLDYGVYAKYRRKIRKAAE